MHTRDANQLKMLIELITWYDITRKTVCCTAFPN